MLPRYRGHPRIATQEEIASLHFSELVPLVKPHRTVLKCKVTCSPAQRENFHAKPQCKSPEHKDRFQDVMSVLGKKNKRK